MKKVAMFLKEVYHKVLERHGEDPTSWECGTLNAKVPQQPISNVTDCGVYVMM